jgi:hypothetical protein
MVLVLAVSCGELSESAVDVINALTEAGRNFRVGGVFVYFMFFFVSLDEQNGIDEQNH